MQIAWSSRPYTQIRDNKRMNQESIKNLISSLGQTDFDRVVSLICHRVFGLNSIDVDGAGDGGSDLRSFETSKGVPVWASTAYQVTIQSQSWKDKAFKDARKAKEKLGAKQYYFLTSQPHQPLSLVGVQTKIVNELDIPATCLGANEIAGFICESNLKRNFYEAIDLRLDVDVDQRPDKKEMLLHAFASLGNERSELRNGVFDDALVVSVYEAGGKIKRDDLVKNASQILSSKAEAIEQLDRRVDSLLARQRLEPTNGHIRLSGDEQLELEASVGVYVRELESCAGAQQQILSELGSASWDLEKSREAAVLLSRCFIQQQLKIAERASLPLTQIGLAKELQNPEAKLKELLRESGLSVAKADDAYEQFVTLCSSQPLIEKLARAVTFIATEGRNIEQASRALGAANWSEVTVTLDASVAIPYLCSKFFAPTKGRFSLGAKKCIDILKKLGADLVIPYMYINETAAHLVRASYFPEDKLFNNAAEASRNGFVSHYHQLKNSHQTVPDSLREFVSTLSSKALRGNGDVFSVANQVMPDLQRLFGDYGVRFESIEVFTGDSSDYRNFRRPAEEGFTHHLNQLNRTKSGRLLNNDVNVLAYSRKRLTQGDTARMCLTWDAAMIAVASELGDCGWVVSPNEASDLVSTSVNFSEVSLTSLAHVVAKADSEEVRIGAQILDRVTSLAKSKLLDWEFQKKFKEFYKEVVDRVLAEGNLGAELDLEVDEFLKANNVKVQPVEDDHNES